MKGCFIHENCLAGFQDALPPPDGGGILGAYSILTGVLSPRFNLHFLAAAAAAHAYRFSVAIRTPSLLKCQLLSAHKYNCWTVWFVPDLSLSIFSYILVDVKPQAQSLAPK